MLQQYLPLAVLKRISRCSLLLFGFALQQYLPLAVLKLFNDVDALRRYLKLQQYLPLAVLKLVEASLRLASLMSLGCNSTYRLRY